MNEPSRKIIISAEIDNEIAGDVMTAILSINDYDRAMERENEDYLLEPIEMYINSIGGDTEAGFAIIGVMRMSETPIITYGLGTVNSIALGIFIVGDIAVASDYCRFMYHTVSYGLDGQIKDHEDAHTESCVLQQMYDKLFFEKTKFTKEFMSDIRKEKRNFYFSAKEAVKLGVANKIAEEPVSDIEQIFEMTDVEFNDIIKEI